MLTRLSAGNALEVASELTRRTPESLSQAPKKLYLALVFCAVEAAEARRYSPATTQVTVHLPLEILAAALGIHRVTAWRHLPALRELGLVDFRAHKGALRGETRNTGMLFCIRLTPERGCKARLSFEELRFKWRDLDRDVKRKRTAYRALQDRVQQSVKGPLDIDIELLRRFVIPETYQDPVRSDCCKDRRLDLESLLDVPSAAKGERNSMVSLAAQALATALSDGSSASFYQKLLWQLLRTHDRLGQDYFYPVYLAACRAKTDAQEGFARRPGALFVSRLKDAPFFDEVIRQPPTRVGALPN
jgi:hypothetical protein